MHCHVDPAIARERRRSAVDAGAGTAHAKIIGDELEDWERAVASFARISIPAPSIEVDTTDGYTPELSEIVAFVDR